MRQDVNITIDYREVQSGIVDHLRSIDGVSTEVRHLAVGDYMVDNGLLIERKRLLDFAESIKDGRLFRQATQLANTPTWTFLILEGSANQLKKKPNASRISTRCTNIVDDQIRYTNTTLTRP